MPRIQTNPLHPDVVVDLFRHGHAAPHDPSEPASVGDFKRQLSEKGIAQAKALGATLGEYDLIVTSGADRAQHTARLALGGKIAGVHFGKGRELYAPQGVVEYDAFWAMLEALEAEKLDSSLYANYVARDCGAFATFRAESVEVIASLPGIKRARRIAVFNHAVCGNAIIHALFPQHVDIVGHLKMDPCDAIRATRDSCELVKLAVPA